MMRSPRSSPLHIYHHYSNRTVEIEIWLPLISSPGLDLPRNEAYFPRKALAMRFAPVGVACDTKSPQKNIGLGAPQRLS